MFLPLARFQDSDLLHAISDQIKVQAGAMPPDHAHPLITQQGARLLALAQEIGHRVLLSQGGELSRQRAELPRDCVRAALTTADFGDMLANTVRVLVNQSLAPNLGHRALAQPIELTDLRPAGTGTIQPDEIAERDESGEFRVTALRATEGGSVQLNYWGRVIEITPEVLLNDDAQLIVTAVHKIAASIGRVEARKMIGVLTANPELPDGSPVFHSDFGNDLDLSGAFSVDAFGAGIAALRLQKATDGSEPLNLPPRFLLCHPNNEVTSRSTLFTCQMHEMIEVFPHSKVGETEAIWLTGPDQMAVLGLAHMKGSKGEPMVDTGKRFASGGVGQRVTHMFDAKVLGRVGAVRVR